MTKLDAANHFTPAHLDDKDNWALVEAAKVFYSSGFFLTVSPESMLKVAGHAGANGKHFAMNLSAPFLVQVPIFKDRMLEVCTTRLINLIDYVINVLSSFSR